MTSLGFSFHRDAVFPRCRHSLSCRKTWNERWNDFLPQDLSSRLLLFGETSYLLLYTPPPSSWEGGKSEQNMSSRENWAAFRVRKVPLESSMFTPSSLHCWEMKSNLPRTWFNFWLTTSWLRANCQTLNSKTGTNALWGNICAPYPKYFARESTQSQQFGTCRSLRETYIFTKSLPPPAHHGFLRMCIQ